MLKIFIWIVIGPNSVVGEDGYYYGTQNTYSVKWISPYGIIYSISSKVFNNKFPQAKTWLLPTFEK